MINNNAKSKNYSSKDVKRKKFAKKREIDEWVSNYIADRNLVVMRDRRTGEPLACSFTEEGLKLTCNKGGRLIYYKDAILRHRKLEDGTWAPYIQSKSESKNPNVIIEHFVPRNHYKQKWNHRTKRKEYIYLRDPLTQRFLLDKEGQRIRELNGNLQKAELRWTDKAIRLTYGMEEEYYGK